MFLSMGISENLWSCIKGIKPPFELQGGTQNCPGVTARESGLISHGGENLVVFLRFQRKLRVPFELRLGPQGTSCVISGKSGLVSSCGGHFRIHLESLQ